MKTLIVVDMQHDFIDGTLGTPEAIAIVPAVARKIDSRLQEGWQVIYTKDTHTENYLQTQEGHHLPVMHCVKHTPGWEIPETLRREGCQVVEKPSFGSRELAELLATDPALECVELVGLCTDICVISNALLLKAYLPELPISVDASCCAGVTPESHRNALTSLKMCQVEIINE